jgi:DNA (cytosine-5)-methyltransferase 1
MGQAYFAEGGKSGWWRRLSWDRPAPTILGMPDHSSTALVHPDELRCLSVNECAAIQTFPTGTCFAGSSRSRYQQIGNAVPPLLAEQVGRHVAAFLDGKRFDVPSAPEWKHASANRRIGTHGWAIPRDGSTFYHLHVRVRGDHIWSQASDSLWSRLEVTDPAA